MDKLFHQNFFTAIISSPLAPVLHIPHQMKWSKDDVQTFLTEKKIEVKNNTKYSSSDKRATIFLGAHHCFFDPLYLYPLISFDTTKLVGLKIISILFPFVNKNLIPVSSRNLIKGGGWLAPFMWWYSKIEGDNVESAQSMNAAVSIVSVEELAQNNSILIFPDGGIRADQWFKGVGWIIVDFFEKYPKKELVLHPFYLENASTGKILTQNMRILFGFQRPYQIELSDKKPMLLTSTSLKDLGLSTSTDKKSQVTWLVEKLRKWYVSPLVHDLQ